MDSTTGANYEGLASHYVAVSNASVANDFSSDKKTATEQWSVATDPVYCHPKHIDSNLIAKWCR